MPVNIVIHFADEQATLLKAERKKTGIPVNEIVRRAVRCWLNPFPCELCLANYKEPKEEQTDEQL
jgi:hypothetical protein